MHRNLKCENVLLNSERLRRITPDAVTGRLAKGFGRRRDALFGLPVDLCSYGVILSHVLTGKDPRQTPISR
jgi:hypothetical protein